jgi:phosphopantetheinyl transferase
MSPRAYLHVACGSSQALLGSRSRSEWARWLSPGEREVLERLAHPHRRESWMGGRLLGKQLLLNEVLRAPERDDGVGPEQIEIHSLDVLGRPTRPRVTVRGRLQPWHLSIAHTHRSVLVAVSCSSRLSVGVDVTGVSSSSSGFRELWLTAAERRWCENTQDPRLVSTLWAIKEALYKAANRGERFAPASIEVSPGLKGGYGWYPNGRGSRSAATVQVNSLDGEIAAIVTVPTAEASA